jgi:opacity protein-like surface antigen
MKRRHSLLAAAVLLTGCASAPAPADYAAERPVFELERYFDGKVSAHGIFTDRGGKVVRRFSVAMDCRWNGDEGVLDEDFSYSDGKKERRVWHIKKLPGGRYAGTAADVVGTAQGQAAGNALQWNYTLRLPVDGSVYEVRFDDWMFLVDDKVMLNKAVMSKFGLRLGEVTLAFHKP